MNISQKRGFALLMTLLVVAVVITAGLTILDISTKQVRLSGSAKDSEIAFSAANAGLECGRYWRRKKATAMEDGDDDVGFRCFVAGVTYEDHTPVAVLSGVGRAHVYDYDFQWGSGVNTRCSRVTTLLIVSEVDSETRVAAAEIASHIPSYQGSVKVCPVGGICTIISSRGFNRSCSTISSPGTIEREVLLEY